MLLLLPESEGLRHLLSGRQRAGGHNVGLPA